MPDETISALRSGEVRRSLAHDSAAGHVSGAARYIDDMPEPPGTLHACPGVCSTAPGSVRKLDLTKVRHANQVVAVLTADDVPGENNIGPVVHDEPVIAEGQVEFVGQPLFVVIAETRLAARKAAKLAEIDIAVSDGVYTVEDALDAESELHPPTLMGRGDVEPGLEQSAHVVQGEIRIGGQDHFYLEGQVSLAVPGEGSEVTVYCSTQHPSEVQMLIAHALSVPLMDVTVEVRRMGGAFGGKETQAAQFAVMAALAAVKLGRPVKVRLDRDDDMIMTGKRHDFLGRYAIGVDDEGNIQAADITLASRCGFSHDLSRPINDRAVAHSDNAYYLPAVRIRSHRCKTHTVSNTAFRGFGGPQGMMVIERAMDAVAAKLGRDPLTVRRRNLYGDAPRNLTPYEMEVEDNVAPALVDQLVRESRYEERRAEILAFNDENNLTKRGIALTPVKFGISFTNTFLNQAGALVHVYRDGSVHLNHGGTEMGQGLFIKVAQIVADEFGLPLGHVKITATRTDKVPNTSATAASSGTDMNGRAAQEAARTIKARLCDMFRRHTGSKSNLIRFANSEVTDGHFTLPFFQLVSLAYFDRVSLSSTGYYKTPKIKWDPDAGKGRPFLYFGYGAAVSEVEIDTLTGEYRVGAVDILHDVGRSLNPAIDFGQIEGGFIQGMGWLTTEELVFDERGNLNTHAPSTYKIPCAGDRPERFSMKLFDNENREGNLYQSKAVGEPPLMLAISVHSALCHAVSGAGPDRWWPNLDAPATPERVLKALKEAKAA
ncbi:MAG: xanthine dehydrogenase molybdopterin binding subunit [Pseudomonadota bacterium]